MKIIINDGKDSLDSILMTESEKKAIDFLSNLEDGNIYSSIAMAAKLGLARSYFVSSFTSKPHFSKFKAKYRRCNYWGNAKTIAEFKKQYGI